jgi:hypothetical protein
MPKAKKPEEAVEDLRSHIERWQKYYDSIGKTDAFGHVVKFVQVIFVDGKVPKERSRGRQDGFVRFNLQVVYDSGLDRGQIKQTDAAFEVPITFDLSNPSAEETLLASVPIGISGEYEHVHLDENIYDGP